MAKVKKISVNAFEKVVKEKFNNVITEEWNGLEVVITRTIPLQEAMRLVAEVADNCFLEDGRYMPEVMQPLLECGVVERYTNISLSSNLATRYELVMKSGIMDFVLSYINSTQYNDIVLAIRDKLDYLCDSKTIELNRAIEKMTASINEIQESTKDLFANISSEDIQKIVDAYGSDRKIEEKVVEEYIKQKYSSTETVGE